MDEKPLHFDITDFRGRRIVCYEERWNEHVIDEPDHPYMEGAEDEVIETLQDPEYGIRYLDRRYDDPVFHDKRIYYKLSKSGDYYIKVVVKNDDETGEAGQVWTAYMPDGKEDGEKPEF